MVLLVVLVACGGLWAWIAGMRGGDGSSRDRSVANAAHDSEHERADASSTPRHRTPTSSAASSATETPTQEQRRVELRVVTAIEEEPIDGARVQFLRWRRPAEVVWPPDTSSPEGRPEVVDEAHTSRNGRATFLRADEEWELIRVDAIGYASVIVDADWEVIELWPATSHRLLVVDTEDDPVPSASAAIHSDGYLPAVETVHADEAGMLEFSSGAGAEMVVRAPGFAPVWIEDVLEWGGAAVVLHAGMSIEGIVVTSAGVPVSGALVDGVFNHEPVRSGPDGRFRLAGLLPSANAESIAAHTDEGHSPDSQVRPGSRNVRLVLQELCRIRGRVLHADGSPAAGATLHATGLPLGVVVADDGRFEVDGLVPGTVRLEALLPSTALPGDHADTRGERGVVELTLAAGEVAENVEVQLAPVPASCVYFRVETQDGARVHGCAMSYDYAHDGGFQVSHGSSVDGVWWRLSVPVGTPIALSFSTASDDEIADSFEATVVTRARPEGEPDVVLAPHVSDGRIELTLTTVRTDGVAIAEGADANWLVGLQNPRRITGLPPGSPPTGVVLLPRGKSASLMAWADGCGTLGLTIPLSDEPQQSFECRLPPESLVSGHLVTRTGRPVTRAHVEVLVKRDDGTTSLSVASYDQLLPGGEFVADQLSSGHGRITVWDSERRIVAERTFEVPEGGRVELGDVVIGYLPHVRGTVTLDGAPAPGVGVRASVSDRSYAETSTGPDGTFDLQAPLRPDACLEIVAGGCAIRYSLEEALAASPVRVRADAPGALRWSLEPRLEAGQVIRSFETRLPGGLLVLQSPLRDSERPFDLRLVPAGVLEISARAIASDGSELVWRARPVVIAGELTPVTLTLER